MPRLAPRAVATNGTIRYEFSKAWADLSIRCVVQTPERGCFRLRPGSHRLDESAASYSSAGWSPPVEYQTFRLDKEVRNSVYAGTRPASAVKTEGSMVLSKARPPVWFRAPCSMQ